MSAFRRLRRKILTLFGFARSVHPSPPKRPAWFIRDFEICSIAATTDRLDVPIAPHLEAVFGLEVDDYGPMFGVDQYERRSIAWFGECWVPRYKRVWLTHHDERTAGVCDRDQPLEIPAPERLWIFNRTPRHR